MCVFRFTLCALWMAGSKRSKQSARPPADLDGDNPEGTAVKVVCVCLLCALCRLKAVKGPSKVHVHPLTLTAIIQKERQ